MHPPPPLSCLTAVWDTTLFEVSILGTVGDMVMKNGNVHEDEYLVNENDVIIVLYYRF